MATIGRTVVRFQDVAGVRRRSVGSYTGPADYEDGTGDVINASELGLGRVEMFSTSNIPCDSAGANNRIINWLIASDGSTVTVRWFTALGTEVADDVDLSAYVLRFEAIGK